MSFWVNRNSSFSLLPLPILQKRGRIDLMPRPDQEKGQPPSLKDRFNERSLLINLQSSSHFLWFQYFLQSRRWSRILSEECIGQSCVRNPQRSLRSPNTREDSNHRSCPRKKERIQTKMRRNPSLAMRRYLLKKFSN